MNKFYKHEEGYIVGVTSNGTKFYIDKEDLDVVQHFSWYIDEYGYIRTKDYSCGIQSIRLHRMVLHLEDPETKVDHINSNKVDNRKSNLRVCTQAENCMNRMMQSNNTSGYKGVCWKKGNNKWVARIRLNRKLIHIGYFTNKEQAALAYNDAAIKYHGEYAKLNVI